MRVRVHPADTWGCGHYRMIWPTKVLQSRGHDVHIAAGDTGGSGIGGRVMNGNIVELIIKPEYEADVYVFQRTTSKHVMQMIKLLRQRGKTVVIDMDDDLSTIHPKNAAFDMLHPSRPDGNWLHAAEACRHATLVTISTPNLARRYGGRRARVLWNYVPESYLSVKPTVNREQRVWGWAGSLHSHPNDVPILRSICDNMRDHPFKLVGNPQGMGHILGLREDPPGPGIVELNDWPQSIVDTLDVGVAPLADTEFNSSKSWLKPLEYSALGIPWVASGSVEYTRLANLIGGRIASSVRARHWTGHLRELLTNDRLYEEESQRLRSMAAEYTIEKHADEWWSTWVEAYEMDHGTAPMATSFTATVNV